MDGGAERRGLDVAQTPRPEHDLPVVEAAQGRGVTEEVLATAVHALALDAAHVGDAHPAHQLGIFAVGLLEPAPPRVAGDVEDRREGEAAADGADLAPDDDRHLLHHIGVPRGRQADRLREVGRAGGHQPRQGLLVGERRDAESRPLLEEALDPVDGLGRRDRVEPGARDPRDLADAVRQVLRHPLVVELALDEQVGVPDAGRAARTSPRASSARAARRRSLNQLLRLAPHLVGVVGEEPALGDQLVQPGLNRAT